MKKLINSVYDFFDDYELNSSRELEEARLERVYRVIKYVGLAIVLFFGLVFFSSCSAKVEYVPYYVPTYCEIEEIERPTYKGDSVLNTIALMEYVEQLEVVLKKCVK